MYMIFNILIYILGENSASQLYDCKYINLHIGREAVHYKYMIFSILLYISGGEKYISSV